MESTCENPRCGKQFERKRRDQRFCSSTCRSQVHRAIHGLNGHAAVVEKPAAPAATRPAFIAGEKVEIPEGLPPQAAWITRQQDRQIEALQQELKRVQDRADALATERDKARTELAELKTDMRIKEVESAKPTGLGALLPNGIESLLTNEHVAPVLGRLLSKLVPVESEIQGLPQSTPAGAIMQWIEAQQPATQQLFGELVAGIMQQDPSKVDDMLKRMARLLSSGTTMQTQKANVDANGTFNY